MQTDEKYSSSYSMSSGYNSASVPNSNDNTRIKRENSINNGKTSQQNNYSTYMSSSDLMASNFMKNSNSKILNFKMFTAKIAFLFRDCDPSLGV